MSKSKNYLVIFLTVGTLVAFVLIILYSFYLSLGTNCPLSERLTYVADALMGLIGGIVASAFGVELPQGDKDQSISRYTHKMSSVGNFVITGKIRNLDPPDKAKEILGNLYVWVYMLIGLAAIVIWALDKSQLTIIDNLATVSMGLILVIVKNFLE